MLLLPVAYLVIFSYVPMYGVQIAFKRFNAGLGITRSPWVGFEHFIKFFESYLFVRTIRNTLEISLYSLIVGFPFPIILAIALNCCRRPRYKRVVQMVTYAPHFISLVVLCGMILQFLSPKFGIINNVIKFLGGKEILFIASPEYFSSIYVWSGIWQNVGWSSIIYVAALSGIDPELHEAAIIDGASRLKRVRYIDLPGILPTIIILLILSFGSIMSVGFEKVLLLQNSQNLERSEIISTYLYKVGLASSMPNYSYSTAIGLFNSAINFILLIFINTLSKKVSQTSLW